MARRIRWAAKNLARLGFVATVIAVAPQLRAMSRAGLEPDWTYALWGLGAFGLGVAVLVVFWILDGARARG